MDLDTQDAESQSTQSIQAILDRMDNDAFNMYLVFVICIKSDVIHINDLKNLRLVNKIYREYVVRYFYDNYWWDAEMLPKKHNLEWSRIMKMTNVSDVRDIYPNVKHIRCSSQYSQSYYLLSTNIKTLNMTKSFSDPNIDLLRFTSLTELHLNCYHNTMITSLPKTLVSITFSGLFNQVILSGTFHEGIEYIYFSNLFNRELLPGVLPSTLKTLYLMGGYNCVFRPNVLPQGITKLSLESYNHGLNTLPRQIKELYLHSYNIELHPGDLSESLRILSLKKYLQRITYGSLPSKLTSLTLSNSFHWYLDINMLPKSLTRLHLKYYHWNTLSGVIPDNVYLLISNVTMNKENTPKHLRVLITNNLNNTRRNMLDISDTRDLTIIGMNHPMANRYLNQMNHL